MITKQEPQPRSLNAKDKAILQLDAFQIDESFNIRLSPSTGKALQPSIKHSLKSVFDMTIA